MPLHPIAFLSYVHSDDAYGHITEFCARLTAEMRAQTGEDCRIFQDRNDIAWGQNWKERIEASLDAATFLLPIITPGYFSSEPCRAELERFLKHERKLKRTDLVLPLYYIDTPLLNDEERRKDDKLAVVIASRQFVDWRDLRFEPFTNPQVRRTLARIAAQVSEALERIAGAAPAASAPPKPPRRPPARRRPARTRTEEAAAQQATRAASEAATARAPAAKTELPTLVVCPLHRGDYATISGAIAAAKPGTRILVRPGRYEECLVIDKALEIVGEGNRDDIVIHAMGANVVVFRAAMGRVTNLTLRQAGDGNWFAVDIAQGRLDLEDCDISSESFACIAIHDGADPRLRRNRIHDGNQSGVFVYANGLGLLEDNDICGHALSGVEIKERGNPTLRRNRIHDGRQGGVVVGDHGLGLLEDNDIFGNALPGVEIKEGGNPTLRRNRIHDGEMSGVYVQKKGLGLLEDNDLLANGYAGIWVESGGNPTARGNRINANKRQGVWVGERGSGTYEANDLRNNAGGPWFISGDSLPNVKRANNIEE